MVGTTNRLWMTEYEILKTKHVHALNGDYILIERLAKPERTDLQSGLYYIKVDFHELGPESKLTEYIETHAETELKPIYEYSISEGTTLQLWDARGTPLALAVSYVIHPDAKSVRVVLKVLSVFSEWATCQEDDLLGNPTVYDLEMIIPPHDISKVYVLYSTSDGLDGGRH
jgi:hypothetical protein